MTIRKCFQHFVERLRQYKHVLLTAHNCKLFDAYRLLYRILEYPIFYLCLPTSIEEFADTLPLSRRSFKGELLNFKLETVAKHIPRSDFTFDSHNAEAYLLILQTTLNKYTRPYQLTNQLFSSFTANQTRQVLEHKYQLAATTKR